ncbi:cadherin-like domain-containing protein [Vibrio lentus]|nr:cadherin-like domain-containing protein [Vibrio lentus]
MALLLSWHKDGSFSFTPEKDYNGDVHFTYDVKMVTVV